ncbi:MAG: aldo/keto reductase [Sedimentisphaerales bacterium]|nr:aldo/keto reductase [Sedimentisphaerales bacterium]
MSASRSNGRGMNRRRFFQQTGQKVLGGAASLGLAKHVFAEDSPAAPSETPKPEKPKLEKRNQVEGMSYIQLGRTNLMVSRLSVGGLPWNNNVARRAIAAGVNMVHGASQYGSMEDQQRTLNGIWDKVWYALKQTEGNMESCVDKALKILQRDHVDFILPVVSKTESANYSKIKGDFEKLRQAGKVRKLGVTVHSKPNNIPAIIREVTDADIFDMILTMYQPAVKEKADKELNRAVNDKKIGTMSMKTLQGTPGEDHAAVATACLTGGMIHTILKGMNNMTILDTMLKVTRQAKGDSGEKPADTPKNNQANLLSGACGACGACSICPQGIAISDIMRCRTYYEPNGESLFARRTYRELTVGETVAGCIDCGLCEEVCPRGLAIREHLQAARAKWA